MRGSLALVVLSIVAPSVSAKPIVRGQQLFVSDSVGAIRKDNDLDDKKNGYHTPMVREIENDEDYSEGNGEADGEKVYDAKQVENDEGDGQGDEDDVEGDGEGNGDEEDRAWPAGAKSLIEHSLLIGEEVLESSNVTTVPIQASRDEECPQLSSDMRAQLSANRSALEEWQKIFAESTKAARKASPGPTTTKIAYALLLKDHVAMPRLWEAYFASQAPESFKLLVHVHETYVSEENKLPPTLRDHLTQGAMPTSEWCHLGELQFAMARKLLEDHEVTHIVWLSGDSVPVRSPKAVNAALQMGKSYFCPSAGADRAEMWHALARPHAEALVAAEANLFDLFHHTPGLPCEDEGIFWPMLAVAGAPNNELLKKCVMWADWVGEEGSSFYQATKNLLGPGVLLNSDHPLSFKAIPAEGLNALVSGNNEALFARKFQANAYVVNSTGMQVGSLEEVLSSSLGLAWADAPSQL